MKRREIGEVRRRDGSEQEREKERVRWREEKDRKMKKISKENNSA